MSTTYTYKFEKETTNVSFCLKRLYCGNISGCHLLLLSAFLAANVETLRATGLTSLLLLYNVFVGTRQALSLHENSSSSVR